MIFAMPGERDSEGRQRFSRFDFPGALFFIWLFSL